MGLTERVTEWFKDAVDRRCVDARTTFFDQSLFPWTVELEAASDQIRLELDRLLAHKSQIPAFDQVSARQASLAGSKWKTFFFRVYGLDIQESSSMCPRTAQLISKIPGATTAFFSILESGKHIPPHSGPYKGVLRYHLGLLVPSSDHTCAIRVGSEIRSWSEGKSLIFDDTHEHEAWNHTGSDRVVLFVDFIRPIPGFLGLINRSILSAAKYIHPEVKEVRNNAQKYAKAMQATS
jgi:ornithine lipid ester-linked acyl 2-hydroxylase